MLEYLKLEPKKAHATSIAIILPLSVISGIGYLINGIKADAFTLEMTIPFGILGAALGACLLLKIKSKWLKKGFAIVMIVSAIRLLLR